MLGNTFSYPHLHLRSELFRFFAFQTLGVDDICPRQNIFSTKYLIIVYFNYLSSSVASLSE